MTSSPFATPRRAPQAPALSETLTKVLPHGSRFTIYHLSTPPTRTEPLCSAPPDARPDKTFIERHFLAVSIDIPSSPSTTATTASGATKRSSPGADDLKDMDKDNKKQVLVLGLEVFLFTTAYATTLFVSKADSTGFLHLLHLPRGAPSPIRTICSAFVSYLIEHRRRPGVQFVVNLFARAQPQYLFPGSAGNDGKHVLSDFGLVRWWCRVLDEAISDVASPDGSSDSDNAKLKKRKKEDANAKWGSVQGYLIVPGLEDNQTRALLPKSKPSSSSPSPPKWTLGHPMQRLSHYTAEYDWVPLRCLIPRYPDDPKSRFRDELDDEAAKWKQDMGVWRSVKSLDTFWDMMAFRQECSSGRLTGFIWAVFDPPGGSKAEAEAEEQKEGVASSSSQASNNTQQQQQLQTPAQSQQISTPNASFDGLPVMMPAPIPSLAAPPSTPPRRRVDISATTPHSSPLKLDLTPSKLHNNTSPGEKPNDKPKKAQPKKRKKKKLTGRIVPRAPTVKTAQRNYLLDRGPASTAYYHWPAAGRGERVVAEADYKRCVELLLHLDFAGMDKASVSSARWIGEVGMGSSRWGQEVVGRLRVVPVGGGGAAAAATTTTNNGVLSLGGGLVSRKAKEKPQPEPEPEPEKTRVNVLGAGLVRKKAKTGEMAAPPAATEPEALMVNVLGAELVRKKPKVAVAEER